MTSRVIFLLGRTVWKRKSEGWVHESFETGQAPRAVDRLIEILSEPAVESSAVVVFEPEGIVHQAVETPRVKRAIFATLARIRDEHPVVDSENLGWGIEYPEPGPGGTFVTLMHSELTPGLIHLCDACDRAGGTISAAWSAYTVAAACMKPLPFATRARFVLILAPGFAAIASCNRGKRSFRGWAGPMTERDWRSFLAVAGEPEIRASLSIAETKLACGSFVVISEGVPEKMCPVWADLCTAGRIESVLDFDAFATSAGCISTSHPSNLIDAFPKPLDLDRPILVAGVVGLTIGLALSVNMLGISKQTSAEDEVGKVKIASLKDHLLRLESNQREMALLRNRLPSIPESLPVVSHDALTSLTAAIPDALTLTSLVIGKNGDFEIEAIVEGTGFDPNETRHSLAKCGFAPWSSGGWVFEPGTGHLSVRGRCGKSSND